MRKDKFSWFPTTLEVIKILGVAICVAGIFVIIELLTELISLVKGAI